MGLGFRARDKTAELYNHGIPLMLHWLYRRSNSFLVEKIFRVGNGVDNNIRIGVILPNGEQFSADSRKFAPELERVGCL